MTTGNRPRRICIVQLTGIGDVVHALPIANDLKRAHPECVVVWVAEPAPAAVLERHPAVDEVVVFDRARGPTGVIDLAAAMRGRGCDVALNMQRHLKGVFPTLLSGARLRIGLPPSKTREGVRHFHTAHLPEGPWRHTQDQLLAFRGPLGIDPDAPVEWRISFSDQERDAQARWMERMDGAPVAGLVLVDGSCQGAGNPEEVERTVAEQMRVTGYAAFAQRLFEQMFVPESDPRMKAEVIGRALRLPADKLRAVNLAIERGAWGGFRSEFYPT